MSIIKDEDVYPSEEDSQNIFMITLLYFEDLKDLLGKAALIENRIQEIINLCRNSAYKNEQPPDLLDEFMTKRGELWKERNNFKLAVIEKGQALARPEILWPRQFTFDYWRSRFGGSQAPKP